MKTPALLLSLCLLLLLGSAHAAGKGAGHGGNGKPGHGAITLPGGLAGNDNANAQWLPDATRGQVRAQQRMNEQGLEHGQHQPAGKATAKRPKRPHN